MPHVLSVTLTPDEAAYLYEAIRYEAVRDAKLAQAVTASQGLRDDLAAKSAIARKLADVLMPELGEPERYHGIPSTPAGLPALVSVDGQLLVDLDARPEV